MNLNGNIYIRPLTKFLALSASSFVTYFETLASLHFICAVLLRSRACTSVCRKTYIVLSRPCLTNKKVSIIMNRDQRGENLPLTETYKIQVTLLDDSSEASSDCASLRRVLSTVFEVFQVILCVIFAFLVAILIQCTNPYIIALTASVLGFYTFYNIYYLLISIPTSDGSSNSKLLTESNSSTLPVLKSGQTEVSGPEC
eukprot:g8909.t1